MDVVNSSKINISEDNKIKEILNSSDANTLKKDDTSKSIPILKRDNLEISPIINKTQEKENENLSLKIKQKYFPMATEMMGLGKETGQELAKLDTYTLIKEGIHALGVKEDVSEDIATKFSKRQFDKTLNTIGLKALEIVPTKLIDLELRKNLTQEITESISKNLTNSGKSIKLNAKSASVIVKAIEKGKNKGLTSLAEKGLVRTVPDAFKAGRYIPSVSLIHNLRIDGVIGGVTKYVKGKVLDTGNLFIKSSTNITKSEANIAEKIINSSKNNAIRTSEAVVEKVVNKSSERVTKDILEQAINLGTKAEKKVLQKSISKATETAILKTAEKTSVKIASNLVKTLPYVTAAGEAYIMFKDIQVAKDVCTDSNASNLSKFLAGSTVALDGISIASHVSGMGIKVGIIASGASIVTSLATHVTR